MKIVNRLSAFFRDRLFYKPLYANEATQLVTEAASLLESGETITRASWQTYDNYCVFMEQPAISGTQVSIRVKAQWAGMCRIRVDITTSADRVISAWHVIRVKGAPVFGTPPYTNGPQRLEVVA